jgi:NAD(P)-dependent dehydrogenase (short-subunit alcohol dehydrogenase family)
MKDESADLFDLTGEVAIVTGGAGLLGVEHGHALAELGATVILGDLNPVSAQSAADEISSHAYPGRAIGYEMDVTSEKSVQSVLERILSDYGKVSILLNNAAIDPKVISDGVLETSRLENFSLDQWHSQINVGLTGALICTKIFGSEMARSGYGVILNIASDLSVFSPDQRLYRRDGLPESLQPVKPVSYSVIKTALIGLTRYCATYWADRNIRVNVLSPGGVYTSQDDVFVQRLNSRIPMGRMARSSEYRGVVQFLCSRASSYMTGQNVVVDGGRSVW